MLYRTAADESESPRSPSSDKLESLFPRNAAQRISGQRIFHFIPGDTGSGQLRCAAHAADLACCYCPCHGENWQPGGSCLGTRAPRPRLIWVLIFHPEGGRKVQPRMDDREQFSELMARVQRGDESAAAELVARYEAEIRRYIRFRLTTASVRRCIDSLDIYQSVLVKFFVYLERGELQLDRPEQLRNLLLTMARNKVLDHVRKQHAQCRDGRRIVDGDATLDQVADTQDTPSAELAAGEILAAVREQLTDEERLLLDRKLGGSEWQALASELGGTAEGLRKRLSRAVDRAARSLGLIEAEVR